MAIQFQLRRGTTVQNNAFVGAEGEITVDTEKHAIRIHDGVTPGGYTQDFVTESWISDDGLSWYRKYASGWVEQGGITDYMAWNGNGAIKTETLPVPMADANYVATATMLDSTSSWNYPGCAVRSRTTTQIGVGIATLGNGQGNSRCSWEVKGMAA